MSRTKLRPGHQLERDFALWLEQQRGYDRTDVNKRISYNDAAYEIDVYAVRRDRRSLKLARAGFAVYLVIFVSALLGWTQVEQALIATVATFSPQFAGYAGVLGILAGFGVYAYGMKRLETRAFVECKDLKGKVNREVIEKLGFRKLALGDAERQNVGREEWMIVSANGFYAPALSLAKTHEIKCFTPSGGGFIEVQA